MEPISLESRYREEITILNEKCFPEWMHRKRPLPSVSEKEDAKRPVVEEKPLAPELQHSEETNGKELEVKKRKIAPSIAGNVHDLICQVNTKINCIPTDGQGRFFSYASKSSSHHQTSFDMWPKRWVDIGIVLLSILTLTCTAYCLVYSI